MTVRCFWLEPTDRTQVGLRRYSDGPCPLMPGEFGYHQAMLILGDVPVTWSAVLPQGLSHWFSDGDGEAERFGVPDFSYPGPDDPRWPSACLCGHAFAPSDEHQEWSERLYERADTGEMFTLRDAPDGAMWDAPWYPRKGPDGRSLVVKCPGGHDWAIDSRASNCTLPDDDEHRCWVRRGEVPGITVDKNGLTCQAGGGSIQAGNYHGFLRAGEFTP